MTQPACRRQTAAATEGAGGGVGGAQRLGGGKGGLRQAAGGIIQAGRNQARNKSVLTHSVCPLVV